jgi:hypothetical protein
LPVPTWSIKGVTPDELVGKAFICSKKHADTMFECNTTEVYEDSSDTPILTKSGFSIPLKTTAAEFIVMVLANTDFRAVDFILSMDVRRSPGMQTLNVLQDTDLIYTTMMSHPNSTFIVFARSEYQQTANCPLFFAPIEDEFDLFDLGLEPMEMGPVEAEAEAEGEEAPVPYVLDDESGMEAVHRWLEERGFFERHRLFETIATGPLMLGPTYVGSVAVLVTETQLNELFKLEFHASAVCPILIRKKYVLILLACDHNRNHQESIFCSLDDAARSRSPQFVEWIAEYQRQFGFGQFAVAAASLGEFVVGIDDKLEVRGASESSYTIANLNDKAHLTTPLCVWDEETLPEMERLYAERESFHEEENAFGEEEESYEESMDKKKKKKRERPVQKEETKPKRNRIKTSSHVKEALHCAPLDFSLDNSNQIVVRVRPMANADAPEPFAWSRPNKHGAHFVFVPMRKHEVAQVPENARNRLLGECFKKFNLFYINCGPSVDRQQVVLTQVVQAQAGADWVATIASI